MGQLLRLGFPAAMQMVLEVGVFALATTLAARLPAEALAAHQIVLNIASLTFMVPLGVGSATAVLVGQALGRGEQAGAVTTGWRGFQLGVGFMAISGLAFLLFPGPLLGCYTHDPGVIRIGRSILLLAAFFQLADGTQVVGTGALRGLGDTRAPMIANLCGHWFVGLPLGVWLCFGLRYGLAGLWVGLATGLIVVAAALLWRWWASTRKLVPMRALSADFR
jgi:MATE family multidrug resistance protein